MPRCRVLVRELTESDLLSFHTGNIAESRRLNIPRTAYYWYGGFVAKRVVMMLGCYDIYLWNEMMRPDSYVVFVGDARNVVVCYFICQQMCRLLNAVRLNWRKQQGRGEAGLSWMRLRTGTRSSWRRG